MILAVVAALGLVIVRGVLQQVGGDPEDAIALMSRAASGDQIKSGTQATPERIREMADATKEQNIASDNMAQRVEETSAVVEETSAAMHSDAETAQKMEKIASEFNTLIGRFRF